MSAATAPVDLADQVARHMEAKFPEADTIGWIVARDQRDNTTAVVTRHVPGSVVDPLPAVRATYLHVWLHSLRDVGFTAQPRTDMEPFGRPDEDAPGGYAHWLHVTDWQQPKPRPETAQKTASELEHHVHLDPATSPKHKATIWGPSGPVWDVRLRYQPDGGTLHEVAFAWEREALLIFPPDVPGWAHSLAEEHRGCVGVRRDCWLRAPSVGGELP